MAEPAKAVAEWIKENFEPETVEVQDCPAFPYGKLLTDRNGDTMIVYWDILTSKVAYTYPGVDDSDQRRDILRALKEQAAKLGTGDLLRLLDYAKELGNKEP